MTYEMMEAGWRELARTGAKQDWMADWIVPFANTIDAAKKYVVSSSLDQVDWNAELVRGDLDTAVRQPKAQPGRELLVGGVTLPLALAELGLINEYEFVVHPRVVGHGPTLFAGLSKIVDLKLVGWQEYASGAAAMRYQPRTSATQDRHERVSGGSPRERRFQQLDAFLEAAEPSLIERRRVEIEQGCERR